jgi:predicted methyltransferase
MVSEKKEMGIVFTGMINNKNSYTGAGKEKPSLALDLAIPGQRNMVPVSVEQNFFNSVEVGQQVSIQISIQSFKGQLFFKMV